MIQFQFQFFIFILFFSSPERCRSAFFTLRGWCPSHRRRQGHFVGYEGIEPLNSKPVTILLTERGFTDPLWRHIPICTLDGNRTRIYICLKNRSPTVRRQEHLFVGEEGLEPPVSNESGFTVRAATSYRLLSHIFCSPNGDRTRISRVKVLYPNH